MADRHHEVITHSEYANCYEEIQQLIETRQIKIGQKYGWPMIYQWAWDEGNIKDAAHQLLQTVNLDWTDNGSNGVIIIQA